MVMQALPSTSATSARASPASIIGNMVAGSKRKRSQDKKFYAVKTGKNPGIYDTWDECLAQVRGQKGAVFKAFPSVQDAQAFVEGRDLNTGSSIQSYEPKFYAVQNGRLPGVYSDWPTALAQIKGVKNPKHKRFSTQAEAEAFVTAGKNKHSKSIVTNLNPEEEQRRKMIRKSAPGLVINGNWAPKDKDGNINELGRGPLPPGAEDGFDPNVRLAPDGTIVTKTEEEKARTKMMRREHDSPGMLRIYTDGSSLKNGQAGARAGVGVYFGPKDSKNVSEALKGSRQTNQRAELTAILRALDIAPLYCEVTIYTDSKYAIDCVTNWYRNWNTNGWLNSKNKPVENKDLVQDIREKIDERDLLKKGTYFVWVKGHSNDAGNIAADRLAVEGATFGRGISDKAEREEDEDQQLKGKSTTMSDMGSRIPSQYQNGTQMDGDDEVEVEAAYKAMEEAMNEPGDKYDIR